MSGDTRVADVGSASSVTDTEPEPGAPGSINVDHSPTPAPFTVSTTLPNVVTIAVWIPVTEQQLADAPALINRINSRLIWDVKQAEEQEIGYGDGSGEHFAGLFDSGTGIDASPGGYFSSLRSRTSAIPGSFISAQVTCAARTGSPNDRFST